MGAYTLFADVLDYPGPNWPAALARCRAGRFQIAEVGRELDAFAAAVAGLTLGPLQEAYTAAFDMQPEMTLNTGYHIFGDDYARSLFLARLAEIYRDHGFETGSELPDHACLLLRFLDRGGGPECDGLAEEGLAPALARVAERLEAARHPYRHLLRAIVAALPPPALQLARAERSALPVLS